MGFDVIIKGGEIIDGTGKPRIKNDVGLKSGVVAAIGDLTNSEAQTVVDAKGQIVAPGFIDMHSHADQTILIYPRAQNFVSQGVTTSTVTGQCGFSAAPLNKHWLACFWEWNFWDKVEPRKYYQEPVGDLARFKKYAKLAHDLDVNWSSFGDWLDRVESINPGINIVPLVGHGTVRAAVMGEDYRRHATNEEIEQMKTYVKRAMDEGAAGISNGVDYAPNYFASPEESYEVIGAASKQGGLFSTHWRRTGLRVNHGDPGLAKGLKEAIDIAEKTGAPIQIAHLAPGWLTNPTPTTRISKVIAEETLDILNETVEKGVDLAFDVIPNHNTGGVIYTKYLAAFLGPWFKQAGSPEQFAENLKASDMRREIKEFLTTGKWYMLNPIIQPNWANRVRIGGTDAKEYKKFVGKSIANIATVKGVHPIDTLMNIISEDPFTITALGKDDEDITKETFFKHPRAMVAMDTFAVDTQAESTVPPYILPNPNSYGAMARFIRIYANKLLGLEEGIRRITDLPASRLGLKNRGRIANGMKADIVVFRPEKVTEKGNDREPRQYAQGFEWVFVNGKAALKNGELTLLGAGEVIRGR